VGSRRILGRLCNGNDNLKFTHFQFYIHLTIVVGVTGAGGGNWRGDGEHVRFNIPIYAISGEAFFTIIHDHTTLQFCTLFQTPHTNPNAIYIYTIHSLTLVNWPIFIINVYSPSLKRISLSLSYLSLYVSHSRLVYTHVFLYIYIRFRTRIFFSFASTLQYNGSDIVPQAVVSVTGGLVDGGFIEDIVKLQRRWSGSFASAGYCCHTL